jgi:hypothetical protein
MTKSTRTGAGILLLFIIFTSTALAAAGIDIQPENLKFANIDKLKLAYPSLNGQDITIAVISRSITYINGQPQNDYMPDMSHDCLSSAKLEFYNDNLSSPGVSDHSTSVCSILFGNDININVESQDILRYEGIAPTANGKIFEFWYFLKNNVYTNTAPRADIISASIGSVFDDWWTRGMESLAQHKGIIIVSGIGNGANAHEPPLFPGAGANVIGVGVAETIFSKTESNVNDHAKANPTTSSCGPTFDGRCKPDLVAPGDMLVAAADDPNGYELSGDYTSFSTPTVSGTIALLLQYAKTDENIADDFASSQKNSLIKAILMNSAKKLPYWHKGKISKDDDHLAPLDRVQGTGMLDAFAAYKTLQAGRQKAGEVSELGWDSDELENELVSEKIYKLDINEPNDKLITATICWNRHFEDKYPFNRIIEEDTDIRLELWAIDSTGEKEDKLLDFSDSKIDNVEHIYFPADTNYTEYEIIVVMANTDELQPELGQQYSIAWSVSDNPQELSPLWYDLDGNGEINSDDLSILIHNCVQFNQQSDEYMIGDMNSDGTLDEKDLDTFMEKLIPVLEEEKLAVNK